MLKINRNEDVLRKAFDVWGYGSSLGNDEMNYYLSRLSDDLILDFMDSIDINFTGVRICINRDKGIKVSYIIYEPETIVKTRYPLNSYFAVAFAVYAENQKINNFEDFKEYFDKIVDFEVADDFADDSFEFYKEIIRKIKLYSSYDVMFLFIDIT